MNEIEKAIEYFSGYGSPHDKLIVQALKEKAERDKMRCENCERRNKCADLSNTILCTWLHNIQMPRSGFCSYFESKENKNDKL